MNIIKVAIPQQKLFALTYRANMDLNIGDLVMVPFINSSKMAVVLETNLSSDDISFKIKDVEEKLSDYSVSDKFIEFLQMASGYYYEPIGSFIKMSLPIDFTNRKKKTPITPQEFQEFNLKQLSSEQQEALSKIVTDKINLLHGITGSGKTEVFCHYAADILNQGKQVLIMLPEIALSTQILSRIAYSFGTKPIVWHSSITPAKKKEALEQIISGKGRLIIGTRSSLFLPFKNLGLIIVDEEHDASYKQEENICYNARDMAVMRGKVEDICIILSTATPSVETFYNVKLGKYNYIELQSRFYGTLPKCELIDLKISRPEKGSWVSPELYKAISNTLEAGKQTILYLNRKGYAPLVICKSCGYRFNCSNCSSYMTYHKKHNYLKCHHCLHTIPVPTICPSCQEKDSLEKSGPGIERILEEVKEKFPEKNIISLTSDDIDNLAHLKEIIAQIEDGLIDIIIGTQIITKGYDFRNLELVGIIDADMGLVGSELKAMERTFQTLVQVAGRSGRFTEDGKVLIQTYNPDNLLINTLKNYDLDEFYKNELEQRRIMEMPPFTRALSILISGVNNYEVENFSRMLMQQAPIHKDVRIFGPIEAAMQKLKGKHRYKIVAFSHKNLALQKFCHQWFDNKKIPSKFTLKFDFDPYNIF